MKARILCLLALFAFPISSNAMDPAVSVYATTKHTGFRLTRLEDVPFEATDRPFRADVTLVIDPDKKFQTLLGIGGALTDAAAEVFAKLPEKKQSELLHAYYDPKSGIGYTLARTSIHSCDFSSESYTYVAEGDGALKTFDIKHDKQFRIPLIKQALATAGGNLKVFASPWTPPAFMKTNDDMLHGGKLKKEYAQSWANYYVKFIESYESEGIPIWGLTIQNEPASKQKWESCTYSAQEERDFLKNYLGPTLQRAGLGDKKILGWDHNRDKLYDRANVLLSDPDSAKYLWGIGFHWYDLFSWRGPKYENIRRVYEKFPQTHLLHTEGAFDKFDLRKVTQWNLGEIYGSDMIQDFNAGAVGFTDWNILLDEHGGPNHVGNYCFAPIIGNVKTGELIYGTGYYYIGHFSKFIRPGARRIDSSTDRNTLQATAFENPDGSIATVVMNKTESDLGLSLWVHKSGAVLKVPARSILTLVF